MYNNTICKNVFKFYIRPVEIVRDTVLAPQGYYMCSHSDHFIIILCKIFFFDTYKKCLEKQFVNIIV